MTAQSPRPSRALLTDSDALAVARICSVGGLLGESSAVQSMLEKMASIANLKADVLIVGESGSGRELAARCLHDLSGRAGQPFLVLNCALLPPTLAEAELFGCEPGAEGVVSHLTNRHGALERAARGTLLLEEVRELSPALQVKLARALESRRCVRYGGAAETEFRCRVMATAGDVGGRHASRELSRDLNGWLSICQLHVPPLRDRRDDVELLARYFLEVLNAEEGTAKRLSQESIACLKRHRWPGNVRELRNAVHRAFILADGDLDLASAIDRPARTSAIGDGEQLVFAVGTSLAEIERQAIIATLAKCEGNKTRAAALLGVSLKTLYNRLHAYRSRGWLDGENERAEEAS